MIKNGNKSLVFLLALVMFQPSANVVAAFQIPELQKQTTQSQGNSSEGNAVAVTPATTQSVQTIVTGKEACPEPQAGCQNGTNGCKTCDHCVVVETTKKVSDKEIHGKCKDVCWPTACPIHVIWAMLCHQKPEYVCKSRTIHVQMKKKTSKEVCITVCKTREQLAEEEKKQAEKDKSKGK
jgi:hypothetical protein